MPNLVGKMRRLDPRWQAMADLPSTIFETAIVEIVRQGPSTPANPKDGSGGPGDLVRIWPQQEGELIEPNAQVEVLSGPQRVVEGLPQTTANTVTKVHIDLVKRGATDLIRASDMVRVIFGGGDPALEKRMLVIQQTTVGANPLKRVLDCISDEKIRGQ